MVLCLLPCYHFLFILLLTPDERRPKKRLLLRMGSMIAIEFRLSIFVMRIYVAAKLEDAATRLRVSSGRFDELYRNARKACGGSSCLASLLETLAVTDERTVVIWAWQAPHTDRSANFRLEPRDSSQVAPRRWQLEFKRRPSSTPCNEIPRLRNHGRAEKILSAVVQKMLASDCVYHSVSISRFIHHL